MVWLVLLQIFLIALNAIFAGTEIAVISVNETKLEKEVERGNKRAKWLLKMTQNSSGFLATIQVAITLSGFLGAAFASDSFAAVLSGALKRIGIGLSDSVLNTISVVLVTLVISYFSIVFGEMVPKRIAMKNAERFSLTMAGPITVIAKLFAPLVWLLTKSTNGILRLCGIDPESDEEIVTEEDLLLMADAGRKKGTIDDSENDMIRNVFAFDDLTVGEICTHRKEVSILWMDETVAEWEQTIHESRHSVYPVCGDSVDQIIGVLNAKDFFRLNCRDKKAVMEHAVHTPYFVHENLKADQLFSKMKRHADHFAVVLDEYGGMCGIITVTDLVEQLVGDFDDDEMLRQEPEIERLDSRCWKVRGSCSLHDVSRALEYAFPEEEYETFSGFLIGSLGEIPKDGTKLKMQVGPFQVRILDVCQHRIEKAIVHLMEPEKNPVAET
ncbi:hemolysin family protein [uncultured Ruminococcus sp.]|uniref:hemolysin family protein n=1 Tax=uncultured Ruminococcus sp. TaxID=165186 RepID=UPI00266D6E47|nr:hemolysin family protein [uncultured Ruminococcus sp.]